MARIIARCQRTGPRIGVKIRQACKGDHLARMGIHQHRRSAARIHQSHARRENFLGGGLDGQIHRQAQRRMCAGRIAQFGVKLRLKPRNTYDFCGIHGLLPEPCATQNMRGNRAIGVKPNFARAKEQARLAQIMHRLFLLGADGAAQPKEAALRGQLRDQAVIIHLREDFDQTFSRSKRVDHLVGVGVKRIGQKIGGQNAPLPIDNIRAGGLNCACNRGHTRLLRFGGGQGAHAHANRAKAKQKAQSHDQNPPLGPQAQFVPLGFVALAQVFALDVIGVFTLLARFNHP